MDIQKVLNNSAVVTRGSPVERQQPVVGSDESGLTVVREENSSEQQISNLARQLAAAVERAAVRDAKLSRSELAALASKINDKLSGGSYAFSKTSYDAFLPDTDDAELLERARQATAFANGKGANPFAGLSTDQLSLIAYDEGGDFTVNERRAASFELSGQRAAWSVYIVQKMDIERQQSGRTDQGIHEIIDYYRALPAIEEAQIPGNWEVDFMMLLNRQEVEWPEFKTSLVDIMANDWGKREQPSKAHEDVTFDRGSVQDKSL
ncbi:hypothetical protein F3J45_18305 [Pantoea sp. Ap-967]|uniref:hypothetical protein n=1 Tax=Pantoea sp. Ap-967 TaxID=2608362 RepID=UPI00141F194B|nr:hypothetical protein [Pantoea sp. Ap-967]NIE76390.1 hypothetical protein [Pantoea sp. Ap-967]